ncbi:MAG: sulfite dehydrogenase [Dehalococcoidia bacterium]
MIQASAGIAGGLALSRVLPANAQVPPPQPGSLVPPPNPPWSAQGVPFTTVGIRSPYVDIQREGPAPNAPFTDLTEGSNFTPLQELDGIITPSDFHFQRNHAGTAIIDPAEHQVLVHGMVDRPKVYTMDDIKRFPRRTEIRFVECSGNSFGGYPGPDPDTTAQSLHGLTSTSEWGGVPMTTIMQDVGVQSGAEWALFEGADAARMTRSVPRTKLEDDAMLVYIQNGEPIRPEQGFPLRLLLPGWEGNAQIKWLRRIEFGSGPFWTKEETRHYSDALPDTTSRQFTFEMEVKSVITWPSAGKPVPAPGFWEITGIAWSGYGNVTRVEVSVDGGRNWGEATLMQPSLPKAHVRFRFPWVWDGSPRAIMSRATDETGYTQPPRAQLLETRGAEYFYHFNAIQPWVVRDDGTVINGMNREPGELPSGLDIGEDYT